jgi:hypothetical protein
MTSTEFTTLCESLYGAGWQSKPARDLVRDIRTIRRWKTGECPVPKVVVDWLQTKWNERIPSIPVTR